MSHSASKTASKKSPGTFNTHESCCLGTKRNWGFVVVSVQLLLENGCNVHIRDKEGMTPCMWACRMDRIEHFELLSEADPHVCDEEEEDGFERDLSGKTWMHWSVRRTEPLECLKVRLIAMQLELWSAVLQVCANAVCTFADFIN